LAIADFTLVDYMRLDTKGAWDICKVLVDTVEKYGGAINNLWHNFGSMRDDHLRFYGKILEYCHRKGAWMTSAEEICKWWNKTSLIQGAP